MLVPLNLVSDLSQQRNGCGSICDAHFASFWHCSNNLRHWGDLFMHAYVAETRKNDLASIHQLRELADSHFIAVHEYYVKISSSDGTETGKEHAALLNAITQVNKAREDLETLATTEALVEQYGTMRS